MFTFFSFLCLASLPVSALKKILSDFLSQILSDFIRFSNIRNIHTNRQKFMAVSRFLAEHSFNSAEKSFGQFSARGAAWVI
jgi:hypothetical protein